jgi:N-acyl-L-homoserine lactone synthetase
MARTKAQLHEVFKLRHQVYCIERGFEPSDDGEERDEYDPRSRHVILRRRDDGEVVGTVRLIVSDPANPAESLPMQRLCAPALLQSLPWATTGEISRFAISKRRRNSFRDALLLRLGLLRGVVQISGEMGLTHWLAVMERSLIRLHKSTEIHFEPVGPLVSYHGTRQPTFGVIAPVLERIRQGQFPTWNFLTDGGRWCGGWNHGGEAGKSWHPNGDVKVGVHEAFALARVRDAGIERSVGKFYTPAQVAIRPRIFQPSAHSRS